MSTAIIDHNAALPATALPSADQVLVQLDGHDLRVVRYTQFDEPCYLVHASLPDDGAERTLSITIKRKHHRIALLGFEGPLPLTKGGARGKAYEAMLSGNTYLCLSCDGLGYLFLAFDPLQALPTGPAVRSAADFGIEPDAQRVQTAAIQAAIDAVAGSEDWQTLVLGPGHYRSGDLALPANLHLHLAPGAFLQASDDADDLGDASLPGHHRDRACFIHATDAPGIRITGHGHIDGNRAVLDNQRYFKGMALFTRCQDLAIDGPVFSDACGWNTTPRACDRVRIHRLKILSNRPRISCMNTDGCNPDGCQDLRISHCLIHTGDDAVAVKSSDYGGKARDCCDIQVSDILACNNSSTAKVGTETMARRMERIRFERVCAVRTNRLVALDAYDLAAITDVHWQDCHVHELDAAWGDAFLVDLQAPRAAFRPLRAQATARHLTLDNISAAVSGRARIRTRLDGDQRAIAEVHASGLRSADGRVEIELEIDDD